MKLYKMVSITWMIFSMILFSGCGRESDENNTRPLPGKVIKPESVQIGIFEPLTGAYQYAGNIELEGIKLAHELYPEVDGIKLELIIADNESEKLKSAQVVSDLIQKEGADVLIGSWSSTLSISAGPIIKDLKIPAVAPTSTNQEVTLGNNYYFRACYVDSFQGTVMANYAYYDLNARSVMVVSEKGNEYSKGLARFFIERFVELNDAHNDVIQEVEYDPMTEDYQVSIDEALKLDPQFIFLPGAYDASAHWILMAREAGIDAKFLGGDTWDNDVFLTYGGKAVEGSVFSTFFTSEIALTSESVTFINNYRDRYGKEPSAIAALGYDAYLMVMEAVRVSASSDPLEIRNALSEIKDLPGAAGMITMNENGDVSRDLIIKTIENGIIRSIKSIRK